MGYDNTVHLVSINKFPNEKVHFGELLITVELRGMSYDFPKLFDKMNFVISTIKTLMATV